MPLPTPYTGAAPYGRYLEIIAQGQFSEGPSGGTETVPTANVFHYVYTGVGAFVQPTKTAVVNAFDALIGAAMVAALSARWAQTQTTVRFFDDPFDAPTITLVTSAGAITGDCLPPKNAVYMELKTGLRGRNFLGSKHFSPIGDSDTTSTELVTPTPAWWTALKAAVLAQMTVSGTGTYNPCVVSRNLSQLETAPVSIMAANITSIVMRRNIGSLKRRRVKLATAA